jgi:molecular chaperone DnaJ
MRGKGLPHLDGYGTGDELVRVIVYIPERLTAEETELIEKLALIQGDRVEKADRSFFDKLRQTIGV